MLHLINELEKHNIGILLNGEDLELSFGEQEIDPTILQEVRDHKAQLVSFLKKYTVNSNTLEIPAVSLAENYPLSDAQKRLWILSQFEVEASAAYNMPNHIFLDGSYDMESLKKAIVAVIERHEILRTVFKEDAQGEIRQWVLSSNEIAFDIPFIDYEAAADPRSLALDYVQEDSFVPFDLKTGPLLRASLLKLSNDQFIFYYNMHHIISDGWSMEVLAKDVMTYYEAFKTNQEPNLPKLRVHYKDYAVWQLNAIATGDVKENKEYWLNQLSGKLPFLDLPSPYKRPEVTTYNGHSIGSYISKETTLALRGFVKEEGGSLFMGLLAICNVLFHRYTTQNDIIIGTAIAGRDHSNLEDQIGFYISTLALRNTIDPTTNFRDFFTQIKETTLSAFKHQTYPFDRLVEELNVPRNTSRSPVFDVILSLQNTGDRAEKILFEHTVMDQITDLGPCMSKFDLAIAFEEVEDALSLVITFNSDVYSKDTIEHFIVYCRNLLSVAVQQADVAIGQLEFLPEEEKTQLLYGFNDTEFNYTEHLSVVQLFEKQVLESPSAAALIFGEETWSYSELQQNIVRLSAGLIQKYDIQKGDVVAIQLPQNQWAVLAIFSILKAGATYVFIAPELPQNRKAHLLNDADVQLLITDDNGRLNLPDYKGDIFNVADGQVLLETNFTANFSVLNDEDLAYILYTSGTTGKPKGVKIQHSSLSNYLQWASRYYLKDNLLTNNNFGLFTALSFDLTISSLFLPLLNGGSLQLFESNDVLKQLEEYFQRNISCIKLTPTHINLIQELDLKTPTIEMVIVGGEELKKKHVQILHSINPNIKIYNEYGPTEATVGCMVADITDVHAPITIGKPIYNTEIQILDDHLQLVPSGVVGQLYIGGMGLAQGYLNLPELTDEKFVNHPYKKGQQLYNSGDYAVRLPDGSIDFKGRRDNQVKINGYRVELAEIEMAIESQPFVKQAVVVEKSIRKDTKIVAYLISEIELDVSELRLNLDDELSGYMIPHFFKQLDQIPMTRHGKVDVNALPAIDEYEDKPILLPTNKNEEILIEVWKSVLNKTKIGVDDNFFHLGGDSIKSIQIGSRLRRLGFDLNVDILNCPVLKDLAASMILISGDIDQKTIHGKIDLTAAQHLILNEISDSNLPPSIQSFQLKSNHRIDALGLEKCLMFLTTHHDALRIQFKKEGNEWLQINQESLLPKQFIQKQKKSHKEDGLDGLTLFREEMKVHMISENRLFAVGHFQLADEDHLVFMLHQLIADAVSWQVLLEDFQTLYAQFVEDAEFKLPLKTNSFQQWSVIQKERYIDDRVATGTAHWQGVNNTELVPLPVDKPSNGTVAINNQVSFELGKEATTLLHMQIHNVFNTRIEDILLTGLGLALRDQFNIEKSVVNVGNVNCRSLDGSIDVGRTLGLLSCQFPIILDVSGPNTITEIMVKVKEDIRKTSNMGVDYEFHKSQPGTQASLVMPSISFDFLGKPFANNAMFTYQNHCFDTDSTHLGCHNVGLKVTAVIISEQLAISINFASGSYQQETITSLLSHYRKNVAQLIDTLSKENGCFLTPSDLTFKGLSINELDILNLENNLEDVYVLSPAQELMYFHWMSSNSTTTFFEQMSYRLNFSGLVESVVFEAYKKLISRHPILRTSFSTEFGGTLLQMVYKQVSVQFSFETKPAHIASGDLPDYIEAIKSRERDKGFNLHLPSQMSLIVLDLGDNEYEFVWNFHHILIDGWSIGILMNEFLGLLDGIYHQKDVHLPTPAPFVNYIKWLSNINKNESLRFWKNYLSGFGGKSTIPMELTIDETTASNKKAVETLKIEGELLEKMNTLISQIGITQNVFIQGVWGYLLSKYNNTRDVVFGSVVSGRPADLLEVENMVGLFIGSIPIRVRYGLDDTPLDLLTRLRDEAVQSRSHHHINLSEIQSQHELGADLMDHVVVFQNYPKQVAIQHNKKGETPIDGELSVISGDVYKEVNYDFLVGINPFSDSIDIEFQYNEQKYIPQIMENLARHFINLVEGFCVHSEVPMHQLKYLSIQEKEQLLYGFNQTKIEYPKDQTVAQLFEIQAEKTPEAIAIAFEDNKLTYRQLDEWSNQFAHYLKDKYHTQPDDLIGIKLERNQWLLAVVLGIMKSGGAYVPIDINYPEEMIAFIEKDSACKACITKAELEHFMTLQAQYSKDRPSIKTTARHLAYIMYTSGSTGTPKAAMIEHRSIVRLVKASNYYQFTDSDVVLSTGAFSFDATTFEYWGALLNGGTLVLCSQETLLQTELLLQEIQQNSVNVMWFTAGWLNQLVDSDIELFATLKTILVGGDRLSGHHINKLRSTHHNLEIINGYGPTENTTFSLTYNIKEVFENIPIGYPISNSTAYILNQYNQLQPIGVSGEICLGGDGLARGYLNRPQLTEQKFVAHPFEKGERIYKTGDQGKWLLDGRIEFEGRNDSQVKIRGYRIELGEIEQAITAMDVIQQAVVQIKSENNDKTIVAYMVLAGEADKEEIRDQLSQVLPEYMLPNYYVILDVLPLNSNGKVDRKKLPEINEEDIIKKEYVAPRNQTEERIVAIWKEILELDQIGVTDSFFDLGGHSIKAIKVLHKLTAAFDVQLTIKSIFGYPTVEGLATQIDTAKKQNSAINSMKNLKEMEI